MIKKSHKGFTLIELLVVISIILIASSIIFIGGQGGDGVKLSSSQRIVSGIAQGARGQAILKNVITRIIIYSDTNADKDVDKMLRYIGIIYATPEDPDPRNPSSWIAATQGTYLPEGIYFNPELSSSNNWTRSTMLLDYPRLSPQVGGSEEYYYYEFNSNGNLARDFKNAWLVLQAGTLKPGSSGDLEVNFTEEENAGLKTALIFRRTGTTTPVNDPTDIN